MAAVFLAVLAMIPCNVTHAGKGIWYLYRNPIPAAGWCLAGQTRTVIFFGLIAILHIWGNGWILTGLLAGALGYALAEWVIIAGKKLRRKQTL
jgi:hypothetical protein